MKDNSQQKIDRAIALEREAHALLEAKDINKAFRKFDEAGALYQKLEDHTKASLCYASAATCWNIHTGWQPFRNAASRSELAAKEALKAKNYSYACRLFREATFFYEKEGDYDKYSSCSVAAQDANEKFLWEVLVQGEKRDGLAVIGSNVSRTERLGCLLKLMISVINRLIWGYGERPFRTLAIAFFVIMISAGFYGFSGLVNVNGITGDVDLWESVYFSVITFATVGYGDFIPMGWLRIVAIFEALAGITLTPLFLIALTRRYLRMQGSR